MESGLIFTWFGVRFEVNLRFTFIRKGNCRIFSLELHCGTWYLDSLLNFDVGLSRRDFYGTFSMNPLFLFFGAYFALVLVQCEIWRTISFLASTGNSLSFTVSRRLSLNKIIKWIDFIKEIFISSAWRKSRIQESKVFFSSIVVMYYYGKKKQLVIAH